ncbi:sporulation protein YqfC [Thermoanaerobacterium sp. DL9XJH110]|jgi:sporulation protein YqfC|uniref:sporulation protein YqfC n=1 Tax=Thermoanaerobacterium sp. DL9XJH110 TaxID=3386643 RepID=UPI003BB73CFF
MGDNLKRRISDALDLPKDIVLDLPRIVVTGRIAVFIENHRGIVEYNSENVRINTAVGVLGVKGDDLIIKSIVADEITVEGRLKAIEFED